MPRADGSRLLLRMQIRLRGPLRWALPLMRRRMQRELARDLGTIKARPGQSRRSDQRRMRGEGLAFPRR
jgi:hypothetical protein